MKENEALNELKKQIDVILPTTWRSNLIQIRQNSFALICAKKTENEIIPCLIKINNDNDKYSIDINTFDSLTNKNDIETVLGIVAIYYENFIEK